VFLSSCPVRALYNTVQSGLMLVLLRVLTIASCPHTKLASRFLPSPSLEAITSINCPRPICCHRGYVTVVGLYLSHAAKRSPGDSSEAGVLHVHNLRAGLQLQCASNKSAGVWMVLRGGGGGEVKIARLRFCFHSMLSSVAKLRIWFNICCYYRKAFSYLLHVTCYCMLIWVGIHSPLMGIT
jgi:hypothetical protein